MRIRPAIPIDDAEMEGLDTGERIERRFIAAWMHRPEVAAAFDGVAKALAEHGSFSPRLAELLRLRLAYHAQCRPCMAVRYAPDDVDEELVCELERPEEAPDLTEAERAALRFVDLFATNHLAIDEAVYEDLRQHFSEGELVELGAVCALNLGLQHLTATWHAIDELPDSWSAPVFGERMAPWGHGPPIPKRAPVLSDSG
jgi:alkylhydroperoxidase family enzyme